MLFRSSGNTCLHQVVYDERYVKQLEEELARLRHALQACADYCGNCHKHAKAALEGKK